MATEAPTLPPAWFKHAFWHVHRALCRFSGGRFLWTPASKRGWGAMQLTTRGRKSGKERRVIVGYLEDGPNVFVLAMNGWDEGHPAWWYNVEARPDVVVRLPHQKPRRAHAHRAEGSEQERLWQRWLDLEPDTSAYAGQRAVDTPVVVFELGDAVT